MEKTSYAQKINATKFTAQHIANNPADFGGVAVEHAARLVEDGRNDFQFVKTYYCHQCAEFCEASLWAMSDSTATYHSYQPPAPADARAGERDAGERVIHDTDIDGKPRTIIVRDLVLPDTMLYIGGSKTAYRCECGGNVFKKLTPDTFQCNSCRGKVYKDTEAGERTTFHAGDADFEEPTPGEIAEFRIDRQIDEFADYRREQQYGKSL